MRKSLILSATLTLLLAAAAHAAQVGIITVTGQTMGVFKGADTAAGKKDVIRITGYNYEIEAARDPSGMATGKREHKPIYITKELDGTSPLFLHAFTNNENLTIIIEFIKPAERTGAGAAGAAGTGAESVYYTIKLTNAHIVSIHQRVPEPVPGAPAAAARTDGVEEEIGLTFEKIDVDSTAAKTTASDNWSAGR